MKNIFSFKNENLSDKAFSQSMLISVFSIFMCLVLLCSITYAWFTVGVSSGQNRIESGSFALEIDVLDGSDATVSVTGNGDGKHTCTFSAGGTYTVTLTMAEEATATKGYCELTINSVKKQQTESISKDTTVGVEELTFVIVAQEDTVVVFEAKWGISAAEEKISNGDTLTFGGEPVNP